LSLGLVTTWGKLKIFTVITCFALSLFD